MRRPKSERIGKVTRISREVSEIQMLLIPALVLLSIGEHFI